MGRQTIGPKKKQNTGFSIDPDVLAAMDAVRGKIPRSSIVESLIILYNKNPSIIKGAST